MPRPAGARPITDVPGLLALTVMHMSRRLVVVFVTLVGLAGPSLFPPCSAATTMDENGALRDRIVFLGLDVAVEHSAAQGRVQHFTRGTLHVASPDRVVPLAISDVRNISTIREPKIAEISVDIAETRAERSFRPGTDPDRQAVTQQSQMLAYQSELGDRARVAERGLIDAQEVAGSPSGGPGENFAELETQAIVNSNRANVAAVQRQMDVGDYDPWTLADKTRDDGAGAFDAFEVTFQLSSPVDIHDAYAVLMTVIRPPDTPGSPLNVFAFRALPEITNEPRKVRLTHRGLPPGFAFDHYEIHIYAGGRELATNLSKNRVAISRAEAHQFVVLRHVLANKNASIPAGIAQELLPEANRSLPSHQLHRSAEVRIDATGVAVEVRLDTATSADDDALLAALRATPYLPALSNGQPTESQATILLAEIVPRKW